jgi:hypothetical protein
MTGWVIDGGRFRQPMSNFGHRLGSPAWPSSAMTLIILFLVAALIGRYLFAVAARSTLHDFSFSCYGRGRAACLPSLDRRTAGPEFDKARRVFLLPAQLSAGVAKLLLDLL